MKRRPLSVAVALTASTALLLTACGSSDAGSKDNDKIAGSDTGSQEATSSPSASDSAERPDIKLTGGVEDVFEGWETGNATKDAVLADAARAQTAINDAILYGKTDTPGLTFYFQGEALTTSVKWVQ